MRPLSGVVIAILFLVTASPTGAVARSNEATPSSGVTCDVIRPVKAFVDAWNAGAPEQVPVFYDDLSLDLTASDPSGESVTGYGGDPTYFLAQRPASDDLISIPDDATRTIYPWHNSLEPESDQWVYVVQQLTRSFGEGPRLPAQLVAEVDCATATFGSITVHEPGVPVVAPRNTPPTGSACTNDRVAEPLQTVLNASADGDSAVIASRLYTVTGTGDGPD